MNTTSEVLSAIREERLKETNDAARWASYRRAANPPLWFIALVLIAVFGGMLALAAYLLADPRGSLATLKLVTLPVVAVLWIASWLLKRREQAIARVLKSEAPEVYEKMKIERLIS
jgi:hypothetical protein